MFIPIWCSVKNFTKLNIFDKYVCFFQFHFIKYFVLFRLEARQCQDVVVKPVEKITSKQSVVIEAVRFCFLIEFFA